MHETKENAPEPKDLKRQILRQTVAENLALLEGSRLPRESPQKSRPAPPARWPVALAILLPIVFVASFIVIFLRPSALAGAAEPPTVRANQSQVTESIATQDNAALPPSSKRWTGAPRKIDSPPAIDPSVFPLQVRRIVLDPGHGGEDMGTTNGKLFEKDLTLDIGLRLRNLLVDDGFEVAMTREKDEAVVLKDRRDFANKSAADIFVSIHINWIATRQVRGVETYYLGPAKDPQLAELARRENQHSGYSLADQRSIIQSVILNAQHSRSHQLATSIQRSLLGSLRQYRAGLRDRGVKTAPFVVLVATEMPAILAEVSCLSNEEEAELLARPLYRDHIAEALFKGIRGYARQVNQSEDIGS